MNNFIGKGGTSSVVRQEVYEIERHLHSSASWFEKASVPVGETHVADRIGDGAGAFRIDAGNLIWGPWLQVLGSEDTPARNASLTHFDPHQFIVEDTERASTYFIQITRGDSGAEGFAAGRYTEFVYGASVQKETGIIKVQTGRAPAGSKLWARCICPGQNTAWFDFYYGLHEYEK